MGIVLILAYLISDGRLSREITPTPKKQDMEVKKKPQFTLQEKIKH